MPSLPFGMKQDRHNSFLYVKYKTVNTQKPMNSKTQFNFGKLLKILIAVLTALAGSLGLASCV